MVGSLITGGASQSTVGQPEQPRLGHAVLQQDLTPLREVTAIYGATSLMLAQIQAFLLGFGLPLRKQHGNQKPHGLRLLKRPECFLSYEVKSPVV